jgi:hypothetical protein
VNQPYDSSEKQKRFTVVMRGPAALVFEEGRAFGYDDFPSLSSAENRSSADRQQRVFMVQAAENGFAANSIRFSATIDRLDRAESRSHRKASATNPNRSSAMLSIGDSCHTDPRQSAIDCSSVAHRYLRSTGVESSDMRIKGRLSITRIGAAEKSTPDFHLEAGDVGEVPEIIRHQGHPLRHRV